jgi:hypothetical protein
MLYKQAGVQGIWMIEIYHISLGDLQVFEILIISVMRQICDMLIANPPKDYISDRGLAGTCPPSNSDYEWSCTFCHIGIILEAGLKN